MLVVCAFSHVDLHLARELLLWIKTLDGFIQNHELLLVASSQIKRDDAVELNGLGAQVFPKTQTILQITVEEGGWPRACNGMFRFANTWMRGKNKGHFLWLEPDMVPLVPGWLDTLDKAYKQAGKPFFGAVHDQPFRHINGGMIYPQNPDRFSPRMCLAKQIPWDLTDPHLVLARGHNTHLIERKLADPKTNTPCSFPTPESLKQIREGVILFHGCKDGTLIKRLREVHGNKPFNNGHVKGFQKFWANITGKTPKETIIVRRTGAIGDALAATCVANLLREHNVNVEFQTGPVPAKVLRYCPGIKVTDCLSRCDIDLDLTYERDPDRRNKHFAKMFVDAANLSIRSRGIVLEPLNIAPTLNVPQAKLRLWNRRYSELPRPFIGIVPRSNSFNHRTVPDYVWQDAAKHIEGTCFWMGNHALAPDGIEDLRVKEITEVMYAIGNMDMVVSVDSGPAHIAIAMGVPTITILQSSSPACHFSDQRDWSMIQPDHLECLNCQQLLCPVDAAHPPCAEISPWKIVEAVSKKWKGLSTDYVSAVISIYKPTAERLNKCLSHILNQVDEIVVVRDRAGVLPSGTVQHPKINYVVSPQEDSGYGRKCNFAARHTNGQFILFVNDDCFLDPGCVQELLRVIKTDDTIGMVGHLLWYPGRALAQHSGTYRERGGVGWGHRGLKPGTPGPIKEVEEVENVTGASILVRRKAFYDAGAHDERFYLYWDDAALCLSMRSKGWKIMYTPHATAEHIEHQSSSITPNLSQHVTRSAEIFRQTWKPYFDANPDPDVLGTFDFMKGKQ